MKFYFTIYTPVGQFTSEAGEEISDESLFNEAIDSFKEILNSGKDLSFKSNKGKTIILGTESIKNSIFEIYLE